jgi:3-oxoacyl-[acyl-carrier protein] reductase
MDFSGKTILYTGAAGGLGLAASVAFLKCGAKVVAVDIDPVKIAALRPPMSAQAPS